MGCGKKGGPKQGPATAEASPGKPNGGPPETPTSVAVEPVTPGTAVQRYSTTATLEAENQAEIQARVGGVVAKLLVEEGDEVREGQELLTLDDAETALRLQQAQVDLEKKKTIFDRQKRSFDQQVIPEADFEIAKTDYEAAKTAVDLAQHQLSYAHVAAPFRGTVTRRLVNVGQTVNVGNGLFELANFHPLLARIHVPAKEMGTLAQGQQADLVLDSNGSTLTGVVTLVSPIVDASTGTVKVTVGVHSYPAGTRPGDFVHVNVTTAHHEDALRVPNLAVFEDRGERIVYVAQDTVAVRRPVQIGFIDETHTEITDGLTAGEKVIVKGQRALKDGGRIKILEDSGGLADREADSLVSRQGS